MKIYNYGLALVLAFGLAACGGGGGSAGTPAFGGGTGSGGGGGGSGGGGIVAPAYQMGLQLQNAQGVDIAGNSFTASETVKLLATLKTAAGEPAANEIVSFSETGAGLLQFAPASATALTNASGQAVVEAKARSLEALGATSVNASASVAGTAYSVARNLSVTGAVVEGVDPQTLARAVSFVAAVPSDQSIVIAGSGGTGRSETALLQFKVVDGTGAAVPNARVAFQAIPSDAVTLNSTTGTTDGSGIVSASVSSRSIPTSVVVKSTVIGTALSTQSDTLTVTTGTAVPGAFDLSASKYVLNLDVSGDPSTIRIAVADANGNPVADGFPVVASTLYGRVGTSGRGGCVTSNGICSIEYQVQEPRPVDGQLIPVVVTGKAYSVAQARDVEISKTIFLNATSVRWVSLYPIGGNTPVTSFGGLTFDAKCKAVWSGVLGTPESFAAPAGASLTALSFDSQVGVAVTSGSPVPDRLSARTPVDLTFTLDDPAAGGTASLKFTVSAGSFDQQFAATLDYPACTAVQ